MDEIIAAGGITINPTPRSGLDEDREKHKARAERFGTSYVEPKAKRNFQSEFRKKMGPPAPGFKTGVDVYSAEELKKRQSRAQRFGVEEKKFSYVPLQAVDEEQRKERAARFGMEYQAQDQSGLKDQDKGYISADILEERKDHRPEVERRPEAIHLYGVDKMSTRDVQSYFQDFGHASVEWIDDSCCNVVFGDEFSAKRAIVARGQPLETGHAPGLEDKDPSDITSLPFFWHKGPDFVKGKQKIPLIYRMATVADEKGMAPTKPSRHLWNGSGFQQPQKQQGLKRQKHVDQDGDLQMQGTRVKRSKLMRKAKRAAGRGEVEMQEAEEVGGEEPPPEAMEEEDPAELEAARARQRAEGPSGLFSAARAGILPSLTMSGEQKPPSVEPETNVAAPQVNGAAEGNGSVSI